MMCRILLGILCCLAFSVCVGCTVKTWEDTYGDSGGYIPAEQRQEEARMRQEALAAPPPPAAQQDTQAAQAQPASSQHPTPPQGMRLGREYISALSEPCYELYPLDGALSQPLAYCRGKSGWSVVPGIFLSVPPSGSAPVYAAPKGAAPL